MRVIIGVIQIILDCDLLETWENMAFTYCPHGQDGFTWAEVQNCEVIIKSPFILNLSTFYILQNIFNNFPTYSNISLPFEMPTQATFNAIDGEGNGDSILTMDEWAQFVGCD
jgi:hypothetical protein